MHLAIEWKVLGAIGLGYQLVCSKLEIPGVRHLFLSYLIFSFLVSALFQRDRVDSKIQLTHDSSSILRSYARNIVSSKASEFCSLSVIGSARSPLKVAKISPWRTALFKLINFVSYLMITICIRCVEKSATLNHRKKCKQRLSLCYDSELSWRQIVARIFRVKRERGPNEEDNTDEVPLTRISGIWDKNWYSCLRVRVG